MAPIKRKRSVLDIGETEIVDVESAQSSLQQAPRKKTRPSNNESDEDLSQQGSDVETFLERATEFATQQRMKSRLANQPADNGIIESVICNNFMCHTHLEITLGPLINFIIGQNGSGKSAILTAITICLGGKATATNRGGSLKSFIKEGQESAMLSVNIKNSADSAYQQDVYGDSIIVERHFSRSGSSSFKLKSSSGRLISTRKGDLEDICDYFALQIDNPMNVLTQDMARQFLNSSSPYEKYKFFMKGTQLEHLDGDYLIVEQNVDVIDQELWKKLEDVRVFEERAQRAREQLKLSEKQDTLRNTIRKLSDMMGWAQVEEQERILAHYVRSRKTQDEKITALEMTASGLSEAFSQTEQAFENANRGVLEAQISLTPLQEDKDRVKLEHEMFKSERIELQAQARAIVGEINASKQRISKIEKEIEDENRRLSDIDGGRHDERREEIENRRMEAQESKVRLRDHENELPALEDSKNRAMNERKTLQDQVKEKRDELLTNEGRLHSLIRDRGQQRSAYAPSLPRLLTAISQDDGFRQKPVGPIGNHVRLLHPEWSSILEKSLGSTLNSFIVTSKEDQLRLSSLMQKTKCISPILIGNNNALDTRGHEPDPRFETALRVLEVDSDLVRKQLIINQGIDQIILIPDLNEAVDIMKNGRVANVKQSFSHNIERGTGARVGYGYGNNLSQTFIPAFKGTPRMKTDIEYQINSQGEAVQNLKLDLQQLEQRLREKQSCLVRCEQAIVRHMQNTEDKRIEMQQAQSMVEELQDALDQDAIEEGRLEALKDHLKEAEEEKVTHEGSYGEAVIAKDKVYESVKATREQLADMDKQIQEAEAQVMKAESRAMQRANQRSSALRDKTSAIEAVEAEKQKSAKLEKDHELQVAVVEDFTKQANSISPRVPLDEGETGDSIDNKLDKLKKDLSNAEKRLGGSRAEIATSAVKALEAYKQAHQEVQSIEKLAQLLKSTLINRKDRWRRFQKHITSRARVQFFYLLSERGYRGRLMANHKEKKLDLNVQPDSTRRDSKGRSTHGLSGGEKSFSTICLLLSMWEAMGAPIRCLDEFDVFMDSVNRDVSMEMMVKFARDSIGKQFIIITPQGMNKIAPEDQDVKVTRMPDPERGQKTLVFPAAT